MKGEQHRLSPATEPLVLCVCVCVFAGTCEQDSQLPLLTVFQKQEKIVSYPSAIIFSFIIRLSNIYHHKMMLSIIPKKKSICDLYIYTETF